jgi:hypothetical protein
VRIQSKQRRSRPAVWSQRSAFAAVPVLMIAIVGQRSDAFEPQLTLAVLAIGLTLALWAVLAAFIAFRAIWREGKSGFGAAAMGLMVGILLLAYPAYLATRLLLLPAIADVTTSPQLPIDFASVDWTHPPQTTLEATAQMRAYPALLPQRYAADPERVFEQALAAVAGLGWQIVRQDPPITVHLPTPEPIGGPLPQAGANGAAVADIAPQLLTVVEPGHIEAVARTGIVGFREDVAIRIGADEAGAVVDLRSASRVLQHDFGSNAARIERFFRELDRRI